MCCIGRNIVANRPAPETDFSADFTYVDGYDPPAITEQINIRTSQPKMFSLFRSKKSAEPTSVQPLQTTITAGSYSGPRGGSLRRRDNPPSYQQLAPYQQGTPYQQGVPQLLVTAPSRPDTADFTDSDWTRGGGDFRGQNPGQPAWQTMNAVDHTQPMYGRGAGGAFVANGSQAWPPSHQQDMQFEAFQPQSHAAPLSSSAYAGRNGWSSAMQHEGGLLKCGSVHVIFIILVRFSSARNL